MSPFDASLRGGHTPGVATDGTCKLATFAGTLTSRLAMDLSTHRDLTIYPKFGVQDSDKGERDFCD